jgi:hypothetical protein
MGFTKQGDVCLRPRDFYLKGIEKSELLVDIKQAGVVLQLFSRGHAAIYA